MDLLFVHIGEEGEAGQLGGKGGVGGKGGEGGYRGVIAVESFDGNAHPCQRQKQTAVSTPSANKKNQGQRGEDGKDGAGGQHGRHGKPAGDVGFIVNVAVAWNSRYEPSFYGFDSDECWEIRYHDSEPVEPYARCDLRRGSKQYANLLKGTRQPLDVEQGTQEEKTSQRTGFRRGERNQERAVRQEDIPLSHVEEYVADVAEWKAARAATAALEQPRG